MSSLVPFLISCLSDRPCLSDISGGGGILPYSLGGGVPLGSWKSYPLLDQILQILWPYTTQTKNAQLFLISIFCEQSC